MAQIIQITIMPVPILYGVSFSKYAAKSSNFSALRLVVLDYIDLHILA